MKYYKKNGAIKEKEVPVEIKGWVSGRISQSKITDVHRAEYKITVPLQFIKIYCPSCQRESLIMYPGISKCTGCLKYIVASNYNDLENTLIICTSDKVDNTIKEIERRGL